jgi:aminopeptidase N
MSAANAQTIRLKDYKEPEFTTDHVELSFDIGKDNTTVISEVQYYRAPEGIDSNKLILDAQNPNTYEGDTSNNEPYIEEVYLNGTLLKEGRDYTFDNKAQKLIIEIDDQAPDMIVKIKTTLTPEKNTELSGFYKAGEIFCTQCESEGFRRITPFLDRPDVMASYTVNMTAKEKQNHTLLSNGNLVKEGTDKNGNYTATWHDPHKKPAYLFALVNGDLEYVQDTFTTQSGRKVDLRVFTEKGQKERARFALERLIVSMDWDEKAYGREYDLDQFNIVAVENFTFGAMENKSLNVFASSFIFADPQTETDANFFNVDRVVAHEYFHNWTGNRVTLQNWFHLSLKEGFTVLREHEYSEDVGDPDIERINQVTTLRSAQFPSDDGPLAFPVLPKEVDSITNIYGTTTYQKGAEILRMIRRIIGDEDFRKASDLYFDTYDGQAVRIQDLIKCFEDVSGFPFTDKDFMQWYDVAGRPSVNVTQSYDKTKKELTLTFDQTTPSGYAFIMPVEFALIDSKTGKEIEFTDATSGTKTKDGKIILANDVQSVTLKNVPETSVPSVFRSFSAFADVNTDLTEDQLITLLAHDTDGFNRWNAAQVLFMKELQASLNAEIGGSKHTISPKLIKALQSTSDATYGIRAALIALPSMAEFQNTQKGTVIDPKQMASAYGNVKKQLTAGLWTDLSLAEDIYKQHLNPSGDYKYSAEDMGNRSYKNAALNMMASLRDMSALVKAEKQYWNANNMTDRQSALSALNNFDNQIRDKAFADFKSRFAGDVTTMQKYFALQASQKDSDNAIAAVRGILNNEPEFDHKIAHNWIHLIRSFNSNYGAFHREDGEGYKLVADAVLLCDKINSSIAAKLVTSLCEWEKYELPYQGHMLNELKRIALTPDISANLRANVTKSLPAPTGALTPKTPKP